MTSLTPLRWVPFRVVCLLGMDQSAFGAEGSAGDDLSALVPLLGDRDPRGEVRESLLEAVLAAQDHLVVVREGHDVRTNQPVPRAVPTTELYESLLASVATRAHGPRWPVASRSTTPASPTTSAASSRDALIPGAPWGFDGDESGRGAGPAAPGHVRARPFLDEPAGPGGVRCRRTLGAAPVPPESYGGLLQRPARGPPAPPRGRPSPTALAVDIAGLNGWAVGSRLLEARRPGVTFEEWLRYERQLGTLPPSPLGDGAARGPRPDRADRCWTPPTGPAWRPVRPRPCPVDAVLPDGTRVVGSVPLRLRRCRPTGGRPARRSTTRGSNRPTGWRPGSI